MTFEDAVENLEDALKDLESYYNSGFRINRYSYQDLDRTLPRLENICRRFFERREKNEPEEP